MATKFKYKHKETKKWTYGAELELADWPRDVPLPSGMQVDHGAYTNVNSNGVAADGPGKLYNLGGEILTSPSTSVQGPATQFSEIINLWPETSLNYRMGLNIHVRIPGLRDSLTQLRLIQNFTHKVMPTLLDIIDPIPKPVGDSTRERKCYSTRKKDHHTLIKGWRLKLQEKAKTPKEFFEAEAIDLKSKKVYWAINPRCCVNLRQLLQTDTVEFRHFFMPRTPLELAYATQWCRLFLRVALDGGELSPQEFLDEANFYVTKLKAWPKAMEYDAWLDEGWHATSRHQHPPKEIPDRISKWLSDNPKPKGETLCLKL